MKKLKPRQKKIFLSVIALVLAAAIGAGIWFGTRGSGDPVYVYPFDYLGMTEYWGDSQESYGPVSTDKIQTVYLTDTQTVTQVLVSQGDQVKKGDVLMTYDTTLSELELERKRLDVEKQKLDLKEAQAQLDRIRNLKPMDPDAGHIPETEPVLGDKISSVGHEISQKTEYDGSAVEKSMILWMKDGLPVTDGILREVQAKAAEYRAENAKKPDSSASAFPGEETGETVRTETDPEESTGETHDNTEEEGSGENGGASQGSGILENDPEEEPVEPETAEVVLYIRCNGQRVAEETLEIGEEDVRLNKAYTYQDKTYWFRSAVRGDGRELTSLSIPGYPQGNAAAQESWRAAWGGGITIDYMRSLTIRCDKAEEGGMVPLTPGREASLCFSAFMENAPEGGQWSWSVTPETGEGVLKATPNGNFLVLSGQPGNPGDMVRYTVSALYTFQDGDVSRAVKAEFSFATLVEEEEIAGDPVDDFYMILKVTEDDMSRGNRLIWQGFHVFCYEDGEYGFTLFDAFSLEDHTLEPLEEPELPNIDFGSGLTAPQIAKMRSEQEKKVKEQTLNLKMAEADYKIMQSEVNDGKVCASFDGKVVSALTEEETRQDNRPLLKVSAGGGFYIEGSVSELEKDNLKPGQEVTVNDWNNGMTYTGTVESIGDFPSTGDGWTGNGNPLASYYPFTVFVDGEADLQAGNYVSMTYSTAENQNGIYLQKPFVRTENGKSYVLVLGGDGKLEKRDVTLGKSLWGSYTEILSGLSADDLIAFPYGKNVKEGVPAEESDLSTLRGY